MPVQSDGTTGYLEHPDKIVSAYPMSLAVWGTRTSSSGDQYWITQAQSNGDRYVGGYQKSASEAKLAVMQEPGSSRSAQKSGAPNVSSTVLQLMVVVIHSKDSRTIYFGDTNGVTDNATGVNGIANHNLCTLGARHYNSGAASLFIKGALAEAHWYNVALTPADVGNMIADTVKPEAISGWVDGWMLKDFEADGTYTSIGGTRTMTAVGGISASALAHPINRSSGVTTINCTPANADAQGLTAAVTSGGVVAISCTPGAATAAGATAAVRRLIHSDYAINNAGIAQASAAVHYSWFPGGRVGALTGITPTEGTATLQADGSFKTNIDLVPGALMYSVLAGSYLDDAVYWEFF